MTEKKKQKPLATKVMLGSKTNPVRVSYPHVFKPHAMEEGGPAKYSCTFLIDKKDEATIKVVKKAVKAAIEKGKTELWKGKVPKNLRNPLRDGDEERDGEEYKGMYFINASSNNKPGVVDRQVEQIEDTTEFYPGCYCRASVNFFPYDKAGNRGIGAGLMNIQKVKDGENLTGRTKAEDDFDELDDDDDEIELDDDDEIELDDDDEIELDDDDDDEELPF